MLKVKGVKSLALVLYFIIPFLVVAFIKYTLGSSKNGYLPLDKKQSELVDASMHENEAFRLPETIDYIFDVKPILSDRCYLCHGPDDGTREGGLRLDTKEGAYAAIGEHLDKYAIVPGDVESSLLVSRINNPDIEKRMPPVASNLSLTPYEKQVLTKWIAQGAVWKDHWAFVPPVKSKLPKISDSKLAYNEIDHFIIKELESKSLSLSKLSSKEKLIRRVYFDLTGLPPSLKDIDIYLSDNAPDAFEKVVDKLLASSAYGEHMAASWLDTARYADTHGYQDDLQRVMWPWRDWVISAFNRNIPYDDFIKWQLAGDLLPNAGLEQILATGFNRNHKITQEGGVIDEEYRVEYVLDRANTTSKALLGLTMECAQCHDHKYDPISQKEFYSFYSFFNKLNEKGRIEYNEIPEPNITITPKEIEKTLAFINMPDSIKEAKVMVMKDGAPERKTFILKRGLYDAPTDEVETSAPKIALAFSDKFSKDRLGLAHWFFDEQNTLTARVAVNRLWQHIFGVGIVSTSSDFGNQGALPTHPELLDWLAVTYREEGWDMKKMIKRMVMSRTYQQTSEITSELLEIDPDNILLARSSRHKLSAEMIRDNALKVSGLLVEKIGGPSVKPYQPEGLWEETTSGQGLTKYFMDSGENLYRRSLYTFWKRTVPPPSMITFDAATRDYCQVKRQKTSTPLQALVMLNDPQLIEAAQTLALHTLNEETLSDEQRVETIFRKIVSRKPDDLELKTLMTYLNEAFMKIDEIEQEEMIEILSKAKDNNLTLERLQGFTMLTSLVFNLDEAILKG
ncbi:PSD1 and planctomycete cytochrome C domain-containing protein [Tamlana sp. 2201CG12-4]|uniref:PSD1 and planctomycete cytochrome C domain-containing protein n=1 Tax=Tamlana sp. 2201CG12-4 TaxID=3112582 RepID=UPI002DBA33BC|nr:PSD1 and planctomycete cytochrome C domain-containing protein [Tamlana sp. 2201CG12-4]MEC3907187.1 PSD1 and planctomycete cytochrome C domain-containing protein [Tamlana sp. 2201CG12-4]